MPFLTALLLFNIIYIRYIRQYFLNTPEKNGRFQLQIFKYIIKFSKFR